MSGEVFSRHSLLHGAKGGGKNGFCEEKSICKAYLNFKTQNLLNLFLEFNRN